MKNGIYAHALMVLLAALSLASCGEPKGYDKEIWKEEVRLMNGDLIIIDRRNGYGPSGDLSQSSGPLTKAEIRFDYKGKHYEWVQRGIWPKAIQEDPLGRIYVVSTIPYCWAWDEWGMPDSYYVVHRFENGQWMRVDIKEVDPATVFNMGGANYEPDSMTVRHEYMPETAWKYKDSTYEPNKRIVPMHVNRCQKTRIDIREH